MNLPDSGYMRSVSYDGHVVMRQQALAKFAAERRKSGPNPDFYSRLSREQYLETLRQSAIDLLTWTINCHRDLRPAQSR